VQAALVLVCHSSGGNAALLVAERRRVGSLVLVGAGNTTDEIAKDAASRVAMGPGEKPDNLDLVIVHFDFRAIVRNVLHAARRLRPQ